MKKPRPKKKSRKKKKFPEFNKVVGIVQDNDNRQIQIFTKDMLINQIKRDSKKIEKSFDKLCGSDIEKISEFFSQAQFLIVNAFRVSVDKEDDRRLTCSKLLLNASNSLVASIELLRKGFVLQPGMIIRNILETICTVCYIILEDDGHEKFISGKLDSTYTVKYGKKVIEPIGRMNGLLSNQFVHMSDLRNDINPLVEYKEKTEQLTINIGFIKSATWLIYVASELVFYNVLDDHLYWNKISEYGYEYNPSEETKKWMEEFFGI
ncbi:hypothetical protein LPY66_15180 [Dehalobacter sp. DCM]|uniref:hypothetical protein n=1 Tax=Dehalobacter sp. DCM TaxID=2907827 RepID=UPI003081FB05|nr:hypothetical protein LPY66_15180 [Dehalobacter sp. DCM]